MYMYICICIYIYIYIYIYIFNKSIKNAWRPAASRDLVARDPGARFPRELHLSKAPQGNERGAMGSKNPPAY